MSVSQFGLEQALGGHLEKINETLENLNFQLHQIAQSLEWIAQCHYDQFAPTTETTSTRPVPHIAPAKKMAPPTAGKLHRV
jgi:hypothetical protein